MTQTWYRYVDRVYYKDTDQMGVVHHGNYVNWFEIARTEMMREAGFDYQNIEQRGLLLPVIHMDLDYHSSACYNEWIAIYTKVGQFSPIRLKFDYDIRRVTKTEEEEPAISKARYECSGQVTDGEPTGEKLVSGSTLHMWLNENWKPARIDKKAPDIFTLLQGIGEE